MKTIAIFFLISLWNYQTTIAQYDDSPEPILIEEQIEGIEVSLWHL